MTWKEDENDRIENIRSPESSDRRRKMICNKNEPFFCDSYLNSVFLNFKLNVLKSADFTSLDLDLDRFNPI